MRWLWNQFKSPMKHTTCLGNNGWHCFHLKSLFSLCEWAPQTQVDVFCSKAGRNWWVIIAHVDGMNGVVMLWESFETVLMPLTRLPQAWVTIVSLPSVSTHHSFTVSGFLRFGSFWNADQLISGSSTWWCRDRCCCEMRLFSYCSYTLNKSTTGLGDNGRPCFHPESAFSPRTCPP